MMNHKNHGQGFPTACNPQGLGYHGQCSFEKLCFGVVSVFYPQNKVLTRQSDCRVHNLLLSTSGLCLHQLHLFLKVVCMTLHMDSRKMHLSSLPQYIKRSLLKNSPETEKSSMSRQNTFCYKGKNCTDFLKPKINLQFKEPTSII